MGAWGQRASLFCKGFDKMLSLVFLCFYETCRWHFHDFSILAMRLRPLLEVLSIRRNREALPDPTYTLGALPPRPPTVSWKALSLRPSHSPVGRRALHSGPFAHRWKAAAPQTPILKGGVPNLCTLGAMPSNLWLTFPNSLRLPCLRPPALSPLSSPLHPLASLVPCMVCKRSHQMHGIWGSKRSGDEVLFN